MATIHIICKRGKHLAVIRYPLYESGVWPISEAVAKRLVGEGCALYDAKAERSYFGGRIESYRMVETDRAISRRVVFVLRWDQRYRGLRWQGKGHSRERISIVWDEDAAASAP